MNNPMPLKHMTETLLVVLLGGIIALTGIVVAILPPLSVSAVPWAVAFALSLVYPLLLYPLFKSRRADYPFRALHFVPAMMLVLWLGFELLASSVSVFEGFEEVYVWGWTMPAVLTAFFLLVTFCLSVLRQRVSRVGVLLLIIVPFAVLAVLAEQRGWNQKLVATVWPRVGIGGTGTGSIQVALEPSDNPSEEQWRMQLRRMERRTERLNQQQEQGSGRVVKPVEGARSGVLIAVQNAESSSRASSADATASSSSSVARSAPPPRLSSSGPGIESLAVLFLAGYSGVLHQRARKRLKAQS